MAPNPIKPQFYVDILRMGEKPRTVRLVGRDAWAALSLIQAGERGCTPITRPAPRWSHYILKLRRAGINVETIDEKHDGAFAGTHARYVLRDRLHCYGGNLHAYLSQTPEGRRDFPNPDFVRAA